MSADYSNIQPQPQIRKGLAIASLVLGIISIPTAGVLGVGAVTAIALGAIALVKIRKEPAIYGGKGMAIAGIVISAASLFFVIIGAAVVLPRVIRVLQSGRESAAIESLMMIHNRQALYYARNGRFSTLRELADEGLIDLNFANSAALSNYKYTSTADASQDKFCVQATRQRPSVASKDVNVDQDGFIRYVESQTPSPVPCGEGVPIAGAQ